MIYRFHLQLAATQRYTKDEIYFINLFQSNLFSKYTLKNNQLERGFHL